MISGAQASLHTQQERLRVDSRDHAAEQVVDQFHGGACAVRAAVVDVGCDLAEDGQAGVKILFGTANHQDQRAVLGLSLPARHRTIEHADAALLAGFIQLLADLRVDGAEVGVDHALTGGRVGAVLAEHRLDHVWPVWQHTDDQIGAHGHVGWSLDGRGPEAGQILHRLRVQVVDADVKSGLPNVSGDRAPHRAEPDNADLLHGVTLR